MRRFLAVTASVIALLGVLVPTADAQAPAPKVTITGLVDNVTSWQRNMSLHDLNLSRDTDHEWYARTRIRPDITAEIGTAKFVLGIEIDAVYGQTCPNDNYLRCSTDGFGSPSGTGFGTRNGAFGGLDINTDAIGLFELKWAYTEFDVPGAPAGSRLRVGAQPFAITHKLATLATGDFAGAHLTVALTPAIKLNLTYAQIEETASGFTDGFLRGEDFAAFVSVDISPFKGLDIRPIYSYAEFQGPTSSSSRQARGGLGTSQAVYIVNGTSAIVAANATAAGSAGSLTLSSANGTALETRHTLGVDVKWSAGPFFLDPTFFYQWGQREIVPPAGQPNAGTLREQDLRAFLVDVRGGWRAGPLLVELAGMYTSGNKGEEDIRNANEDVNFYQPISTDGVYWAGWGEIFAPGVDYFNAVLAHDNSRGLSPTFAVGYDKYGLFRLGGRASYALTPAFTVRGGITGSWTAEKVDTDGTRSIAGGITPSAADPAGEDRYMGTEVYAGFTWRFAPGLTFDLVGANLFTGDAYKAATTLQNLASPVSGSAAINTPKPDLDPKNVQTVAARVRFSF